MTTTTELINNVRKVNEQNSGLAASMLRSRPEVKKVAGLYALVCMLARWGCSKADVEGAVKLLEESLAS